MRPKVNHTKTDKYFWKPIKPRAFVVKQILSYCSITFTVYSFGITINACLPCRNRSNIYSNRITQVLKGPYKYYSSINLDPAGFTKT